jgi:nucleoside-diphosphate-sugar epimerase
MKRVLVTGASGCVGQNVLPVLLSRGWDVHAVTTKPVPADTAVTWYRADLFDPSQLKDVVRRARATHMLHLGWYLVPGKWTAPRCS